MAHIGPIQLIGVAHDDICIYKGKPNEVVVKPDRDLRIKFTPEIDTIISKLNSEWSRHQGSTPELLYHYCGPEALLGIASTQHLWFTHIRYFDDLSERKYGEKLLLDIISTRKNANITYKQNELLDDLMSFYDPSSQWVPDVFAACFCAKRNVLSQWERFANKSTGYSIGFRFSDSLFLGYDNIKRAHKAQLYRVIYEPQTQHDILSMCFDIIFKYLDTDNSSVFEAQKFFLNIVDTLLYCFKNKHFEQEEEWRLFVDNDSLVWHTRESRWHKINFRASNGYLIPYLPLRLIDTKFDHCSLFPISEIVIGPRANKFEPHSIQLLLAKHDLPFIEPTSSLIPLR